MKKTLAILLLAVQLFNTCGYQLLFSFIENAANNQMVVALNNNSYDERELVEIKFALHMPYLSGNKNYERYDGQIEYNGIQYNYVKRMVRNDTLYLYCIPNKTKTEINNTKTLYARQNADNAQDKKAGQPVVKQLQLAVEYNTINTDFDFDVHPAKPATTVAFNNLTILKGFTQTPLQPPDLSI